ncbi:MAG: hypothetical protein ACXVZ1_08240 [Gaiellaceae bacterium]
MVASPALGRRSRTLSLSSSRRGVTIGAAAAAGIAFRVWTYRSALGIPDSDEAVVGLMARHILHGQFTTFFWGQWYGGSQEALLTAPLFFLFGSSWLLLRLLPMILDGVAALVLWRVGRRTIGEPAATAAAAVFWAWPPFVIYKLTHQWGFYASGVLYCALILLLALRLIEQPTRTRAGVFGLVLGLALWQSAQLVPIVLPVIAWTIWKRRQWLRHLWLTIPLAVLGALPSVVWNILHGWASLSPPIHDPSSYQHRLRVYASPLLPMMLGLRTPFTQERLLPGVVTYLIYALLAGGFVYGAYRSRHRTVSLLYLVVGLYPFIYTISPQTFFEQEPRYLVVLSPLLALLLAQHARSWLRVGIVLVLACAVSFVTLQRLDTYFRTVPSDPPIAPRNIGPLIATLDRLGIHRVFATFWTTYRLDFDTRERIIATQSKILQLRRVDGRAIAVHNRWARWFPYEREVQAAPRAAFVLLRRETHAHRPAMVQLERWGYRRLLVGPYIVYVPPG